MFTAEIDALVADGATFEEIEDEIEWSGLPSDLRRALWLYAWVRVDRKDRQRVVDQMLIGRPFTDLRLRRAIGIAAQQRPSAG